MRPVVDLTRLVIFALAFALCASAAPCWAGDGKLHRVAIQVDTNDPAVIDLALNNAEHVLDAYSTCCARTPRP